MQPHSFEHPLGARGSLELHQLILLIVGIPPLSTNSMVYNCSSINLKYLKQAHCWWEQWRILRGALQATCRNAPHFAVMGQLQHRKGTTLAADGRDRRRMKVLEETKHIVLGMPQHGMFFMLPTVEQSSQAAPADTAAHPQGMPGTCSPGLGVMGILQSPGWRSS